MLVLAPLPSDHSAMLRELSACPRLPTDYSRNRYEESPMLRGISSALQRGCTCRLFRVGTWKARRSAPGAELGHEHDNDNCDPCVGGIGYCLGRFCQQCWRADDQHRRHVLVHDDDDYGHHLVSKPTRTFGNGPFLSIRSGWDLGLKVVSSILVGGSTDSETLELRRLQLVRLRR